MFSKCLLHITWGKDKSTNQAGVGQLNAFINTTQILTQQYREFNIMYSFIKTEAFAEELKCILYDLGSRTSRYNPGFSSLAKKELQSCFSDALDSVPLPTIVSSPDPEVCVCLSKQTTF